MSQPDRDGRTLNILKAKVQGSTSGDTKAVASLVINHTGDDIQSPLPSATFQFEYFFFVLFTHANYTNL